MDRLVIEAGDNTLGVDFHPKLTVIAGVGRLEREGLITELIGAMGSARPGVHLELRDHRSRHLAVFRPTVGRHRVIDTDAAADVSHEFTVDGEIDLLARYGLDLRHARKAMRLSAEDLRLNQESDEAIARLATVDQQRLWAAAQRVSATEDHLQSEAEEVGSAPEDAEIIGQIEERHVALEQSIAHYEKVRFGSIYAGGMSAIIGIAASVRFGPIGIPLLVLAIAAAAAAMMFRARMHRAEAAEEEALEAAGAQSYLGFHLQRVNGLLANDQYRKRLMEAAEANRSAQLEWKTMAGEVPVAFALRNKDAILAAARVSRGVDSLETLSTTMPTISRDVTTDLAQVLVNRLAKTRSIGHAGDSLPLLLDDPFSEVDPSVKPLLLELLSTAAGSPQVIFLTEDEDVASWARLEALTGEVSILEPVPEHDPVDRHSNERHSNHIA